MAAVDDPGGVRVECDVRSVGHGVLPRSSDQVPLGNLTLTSSLGAFVGDTGSVTRTPLSSVACLLIRTTDLFGDAWTALIMRDVLVGISRFDELAEDLSLSRKVLAAWPARLVEEGVLTRARYQASPPREEYAATDKGPELYPVLLTPMTWGDKGYAHSAGLPARIHHDACGHISTPVVTCGACRDPLAVADTTQLPGPGGRVGPGTLLLGPLIAARGCGGKAAEAVVSIPPAPRRGREPALPTVGGARRRPGAGAGAAARCRRPAGCRRR
ncbi:winged helix-turn-helix transcriptional regulator [Streptomyces sp. NPDC102278]|uniref:winged helix-turn-helix transcriptional regulator n=1 Tax=Streptomyces sp. NPDC102278 TaxID=3366152 RepID=UPI0038045219